MAKTLWISFLLFTLTTCATWKFGDALLYGHTKAVTSSDLRAAIAADRANAPPGHPQVSENEVMSTTKIRLFYGRRGKGVDICSEMTRVGSSWRHTGGWIKSD